MQEVGETHGQAIEARKGGTAERGREDERIRWKRKSPESELGQGEVEGRVE